MSEDRAQAEQQSQAIHFLMEKVQTLENAKSNIFPVIVQVVTTAASLVVVMAFAYGFIEKSIAQSNETTKVYMDKSMEIIKSEVSRVVISLDKLSAFQRESENSDSAQNQRLERHEAELANLRRDVNRLESIK
jgi:hypothetical protein